MSALLRLVQLLVCLLFIAWTVVFPLATLLSLMLTVPFVLLFAARTSPRVVLVRR